MEEIKYRYWQRRNFPDLKTEKDSKFQGMVEKV
jgi:hypothetical protein